MEQKTSKKLPLWIPIVAGIVVMLCCLICGITSVLTDDAETPPLTDTCTPMVTRTAQPASALQPTDTPMPTNTPHPTDTPLPTSTPTPEFERTEAQVVEVVDGDTIKVNIDGQVYTVRYIGIDTPETVHPSKPVEWMGTEASAANKQLVEGQTIYLEKDVSETDQYGRLLRYVYLADGLLVNAELVRLGYAQVSTYPPDVRYQAFFLEVQQEAKEAKCGLWGPTPTPLPPTATPLLPTATLAPPTATLAPPTATSAPVAQPTQPPPPPTEPPPPPAATCDCSSDIYNCSNFVTHNQAQACFEYCVSQGRGDIHRLDRDNDGIACESLP